MKAKVPKQRKPAIALPQVTAYVKNQLPDILQKMVRVETMSDNLRKLEFIFEMTKQPKVRDSNQRIELIERSLANLLEAEGYSAVYVNGDTGTQRFFISWQPKMAD